MRVSFRTFVHEQMSLDDDAPVNTHTRTHAPTHVSMVSRKLPVLLGILAMRKKSLRPILLKHMRVYRCGLSWTFLLLNKSEFFLMGKRIKQNQHSKTKVTHFSFNLLTIKGLYMCRALLAQLQEALHKRHLVYCVRVMSVGCTRIRVFHSNPGAANWHKTHAIYQVPLV
jgi:hypothetical protein